MPDRTGSGHAQGWALAATLALALVAPAPVLAQAPGTSAPEAIAALNAQRAAHGIPADLVENPDYSLGCAMHMAYEALHGRSRVSHAEDPGLRGYTPLGDLAARSSVLAGPGSSWAAAHPPRAPAGGDRPRLPRGRRALRAGAAD
jgi:hypothetical protein